MDDKQSRLLGWMAGILAVLVGVLVFVEPPEGAGEDEDEAAAAVHTTRVFPDLETTTVQALTLAHGDGATLRLARVDGGWTVDPGGGPLAADADAVEGLLGSVVRLEAGDALEADPTLPDFGLEAGVGVRLGLADGSELEVRVGADAPVGTGTYLQDAAGALRVSRLRLSATLDQDLDALRAHEVVRFPATAVDRVRIDGAARALILTHDTHGWWVEEEGHRVDGVVAAVPEGRHRADGDRVSDLLRALQDLRVSTFPAAPPALAEGGLQIVLTGGDQTWSVGLAPGQDGATYVTGPLLSGPAPADTSRLDDLLAVPGLAWRSPLLLPVRPITLDRMDVDLGGQALQATRTGETWSDARAAALLEVVADTRLARSSRTPVPAGEAWGHLILAEGTAREETLTFYQAVDGGRVAIDAAGGDAFVVPDDVLARLQGVLGAG